MRRIVVVVLAVLLAGCSQTKMSDLQASCEQGHGDFPGVASCLHGQVASYSASNRDDTPDLTNLYLAWMDAAAVRVRAGEMNDTDARLAAAELYSRLHTIALDRDYAAKADFSRRYGDFLAGIGVWNQLANQQAPQQVITCQHVGPTMVTCF